MANASAPPAAAPIAVVSSLAFLLPRR
ncbi:MAG: hypothetical protein FJ240_10710 [Nitrospira sp.]|nr:hypothetical protein [Nitrospira sp.]